MTVSYPGQAVPALQELSLRIPPGVTLVKGASGAGKSTLLRLLAGLLQPAEGRVCHPWPGTGAASYARVGYLPQAAWVDQVLTVEGGMRYLAGTRGLPAGVVGPVLERWELEGLRRQRLDRLSGGTARRWLLAQSQLTNPALWLLDEPLSGLDAAGVVTLKRELARYRAAAASGRQRYAVAAVQDDRLDDLAVRIFWLDRGRLRCWM